LHSSFWLFIQGKTALVTEFIAHVARTAFGADDCIAGRLFYIGEYVFGPFIRALHQGCRNDIDKEETDYQKHDVIQPVHIHQYRVYDAPVRTVRDSQADEINDVHRDSAKLGEFWVEIINDRSYGKTEFYDNQDHDGCNNRRNDYRNIPWIQAGDQSIHPG
jgi:hypothetical protein